MEMRRSMAARSNHGAGNAGHILTVNVWAESLLQVQPPCFWKPFLTNLGHASSDPSHKNYCEAAPGGLSHSPDAITGRAAGRHSPAMFSAATAACPTYLKRFQGFPPNRWGCSSEAFSMVR